MLTLLTTKSKSPSLSKSAYAAPFENDGSASPQSAALFSNCNPLPPPSVDLPLFLKAKLGTASDGIAAMSFFQSTPSPVMTDFLVSSSLIKLIKSWSVSS